MTAVTDLLDQLVRDPDDDATGLVLADALVAAGDPRGELAQIQSRRAALAALVTLLDTDQEERTTAKGVDIGVAHGLVERISVTLGDDDYKQKRTVAAVLDKLFDDRTMRVVREVRLGIGGSKTKGEAVAKDARAALDLLVARAPVLRSLSVSLYAKNDAVDSDLGPAVLAMPITELSLVAPATVLEKLFAASFERIDRLALRSIGEVANVKRLLDGSTFPALRHFQPDLGAAFLPKLFRSALATRLESLDLKQAGSDLEGAAAKALIAAKPKLKQLRRLALEADYLSTKQLRDLRGFCDEVVGVPDEKQLAWVDAKAAEYERMESDRYEEIVE